MAQSPLPGGPNIIKTPINGPSGTMNDVWQRCFNEMITRIQNGLDQIGKFIGQIGASATIEGHGGTVGTTFQHLTASGKFIADNLIGTVAPAALPPATTIQGAVILPAGSPSNTLGTAALANTSSFDPAGAAAAAQTNAETYADNASNTALNAAKSYTDGKFIGAISGTVALAKLTTGGANGSLTFTNGLITAKVDPT